MQNKEHYLELDWGDLAVPENVTACTSLREGGYSQGNFQSFNLATHVDDDIEHVSANRDKLTNDLELPAEPVWLEQVHSNKVISLDGAITNTTADASTTTLKDKVCVVLTADCLPVFFCDSNGNEVAVAHAGWRGLHAGIISNTVMAMKATANNIMVNLGPAIGPDAFEVGQDVYDAFVNKCGDNRLAFRQHDEQHYYCDIYQLAKTELATLGVNKVTGGEYCTYSDERFYSFRKQSTTGRMVSLIYIK